MSFPALSAQSNVLDRLNSQNTFSLEDLFLLANAQFFFTETLQTAEQLRNEQSSFVSTDDRAVLFAAEDSSREALILAKDLFKTICEKVEFSSSDLEAFMVELLANLAQAQVGGTTREVHQAQFILSFFHTVINVQHFLGIGNLQPVEKKTDIKQEVTSNNPTTVQISTRSINSLISRVKRGYRKGDLKMRDLIA